MEKRKMKEGFADTLLPVRCLPCRKYEALCLGLILALSLFLNLYQNNFPYTYHADEPIKARFIRENTQNFTHPLLMLQVVRLANLFLDYSKKQEIVTLGRTTTAIFGTLIVLFSYLIFRHLLPKGYALLAAFTVALSPILVIHAHYLKEDIILTCFCMLSLLSLMTFVKSSKKGALIYLGVATGLAVSSHYKGALLISLYIVTPFFIPILKKGHYYRRLGISLCIAFLVFAGVNYRAILNVASFLRGSLYELNHSMTGHTLKIPGYLCFFSFHLRYSIIPGMTLLLTLLSAGFITYSLARWRKTRWQNRILLLYVFIFYFVVELSPLKPWPGFIRYVLPIIPVLIYFAVQAVWVISTSASFSRLKLSAFALLLAAICLSGYETVHLVYYIKQDTRRLAARWLKENGQKAIRGPYTDSRPDVPSLTALNISKARDQDIDFLVTSSFMYGRYLFGSNFKAQDKAIYDYAQKYRNLFRLPFIEITPRYKTFAFSNPVIRIIDLRENTSSK